MHPRVFACFLMATPLATGSALADFPAGAVPLHLISAPALSPDGKSMVFEWIDDLWTAPSQGGEAKRMLRHPARDIRPRFSPDGKRIVFSSDRSGSLQVFSIDLAGGEAVQHTHHSEGNELECLSPDGARALVRGIRERSGYQATRLMAIDLSDDRRERRLFDATAHSAAWSPDGSRVLFCRGGESPDRKGYRGSNASQIWLYQIKSRSFECKVAGETEACSPMWLPDGRGFYFVSNKGGTANLWLQNDDAPPLQVTTHQGDGVIEPDLSADGSTLVFCRGFEAFRYRPGTDRDPVPLKLWTRESLPDVTRETRQVTGSPSADFTKDLKQLVFAAAGELWWIEAAGKPPVRLTETAAAEDEVRFSPNGEWLCFLRDDGLSANYFRARLENGTLRDETPVTRGTRSKRRFKPSPDGLQMAWLEGTGDVFTALADGANPRCVYPCWDPPTFDWSPDGRWLALAAEDRDSNRDIWLAATDGRRGAVNLTRHPGFEGSPRWSPDGRWLVFSAQRDGTGKSRLWRVDFGKGGLPPDLSDEAARRLGDHAEMISTADIEPIRTVWAADSKTLWFQNRITSSEKLHSIEWNGSSLRTVVEQRGVPLRVTPDGALLWRVAHTPEILTNSGSVRFPISIRVTRPREEVLTLAFRRIWRTLGENFHDAKMNGSDWESLRLKYESAAAAARDSRQFDRIVRQLLGELNASHLAFQPDPWPEEVFTLSNDIATAHPGWIFRDDDRADAPLRIERVIPGSPAAMLPDAPLAGDTVVRIAGEKVSSGTPLHRFFNGAENRPLPVVLRAPDGRERVIELRCISYRNARSLDLLERASVARARVAAANSKATLLAVPDMKPETLADLELRIYQASMTSEGLILDLRNNRGGREADRMLGWFSQPAHSFTVPRGGPSGYPIDRRPGVAWDKPLVVLCNQNTFSNAEIFCHAVKHQQRAPLVGGTTAGGVISTVEVAIPDAGELQVPFRGWFHAGTGNNLESNGATPDHAVDLTPADEDAGRDPQLDKALQVLKEM